MYSWQRGDCYRTEYLLALEVFKKNNDAKKKKHLKRIASCLGKYGVDIAKEVLSG